MSAYRLVSRTSTVTRQRSAVALSNGVTIGDTEIAVIAGPCAVEGREMITQSAIALASAGASALRGGAFKPRTSPYSFQGLGDSALEMLAEARALSGLPIVTEVVDVRLLERTCEFADVIQIGARNMQNFPLLAETGRCGRPVLLKRGISSTIAELLSAAEYIVAGGNPNVILCERGIRTFETATRNTLDLSAVPLLQMESHLPVVVDPSHGTGRADLVVQLSLAAIAVGADGLLVEVHPEPATARSDAAQSIDFAMFEDLMSRGALVARAVGRTLRHAHTAGDKAARLPGTVNATSDSPSQRITDPFSLPDNIALAAAGAESEIADASSSDWRSPALA